MKRKLDERLRMGCGSRTAKAERMSREGERQGSVEEANKMRRRKQKSGGRWRKGDSRARLTCSYIPKSPPSSNSAAGAAVFDSTFLLAPGAAFFLRDMAGQRNAAFKCGGNSPLETETREKRNFNRAVCAPSVVYDTNEVSDSELGLASMRVSNLQFTNSRSLNYDFIPF